MDQTSFECECAEALDEQNALLACEHLGVLTVFATKLQMPTYQVGGQLTVGGCVVAGGYIQRYREVLYAFTVHIEPFETGRVVSRIEAFDLSGVEGLPVDDPAQRIHRYRLLTDERRGEALREIFANIGCDRKRVLFRYERADIDEEWTLVIDDLYQKLDGNTYCAGDTFSHDQILSFVATFTLIPAITDAGPPQSIIIIAT